MALSQLVLRQPKTLRGTLLRTVGFTESNLLRISLIRRQIKEFRLREGHFELFSRVVDRQG
jgi:hypothetical protein